MYLFRIPKSDCTGNHEAAGCDLPQNLGSYILFARRGLCVDYPQCMRGTFGKFVPVLNPVLEQYKDDFLCKGNYQYQTHNVELFIKGSTHKGRMIGGSKS